MPDASAYSEGELTEFERLKDGVHKDQNHHKEWRQWARECYDYVAGNQWSEEDRQFLKLANRPIITFNRVDPVVDSVSGLEVNNRQEVRYFPRHLGDAGVDELLTGAAKWCRDECNAEDEESDAFRDQVICGLGWTETRVDYDEDPEGMMLINRVDPLEVYPDSSSKRKNYEDGRRVTRIRDLPMDIVHDMFPDAELSDLHADWAMDTGADAHQPHDAIQAVFYTEDQTDLIDKNRILCRVVEIQWWEHEDCYRMVDPMTQTATTVTKDEYKKLSERLELLGFPKMKAVKQKHKKYFKAWLGKKILEKVEGPKEGGFTLKAMTGKRDRNKGTYYGLVRAMIDPQKWANKWMSQVMFIVNTNAKGGIVAEESAFANPQEAIDNWADPAAVTLMKNGAVSGGKWAPKPQTPWPQGLEGLMQFAIQSIRDAAGVNLEMIGQADRDQAGILEHQRKQAAMTILAGLFDSLRRYRKEQGRLILYYITNFLSDGRLIRIGGPQQAKYVPLTRQADTVKYDVIVDDTPNSVNIKEQAWATISQMLPILTKMPIPLPVWLSVLKYSPLPESLVADITTALEQAAQQPHQDPKMQVAQLDLQGKQIDLERSKLELQVQQGESADSQMQTRADMMNKSYEADKLQSEAVRNRAAAVLDLAKAGEAKHDMKMDRHSAALDTHAAVLDHIGTMVDAHTKLNPPKEKVNG